MGSPFEEELPLRRLFEAQQGGLDRLAPLAAQAAVSEDELPGDLGNFPQVK